MRALLSRIRYFLTDAVDEWRYSPGVNIVATATLASALFLAGLLLLVLSNVGGRISDLREDVRVEIYLHDGIAAEARRTIEERLAASGDVSRVQFVDKTEALRRFRESFGALADIPAELEINPLPASLEVFLSPGTASVDAARRIAAEFSDLEGVEEVRYDRAWLDRLDTLLRLATLGGAGLAAVVFSAVIFVMASVLRLAVYARREEIEIMLLVGASPAFVRGPFLVAGAVQGLGAALGALLVVEAVRRSALGWPGASPGALLDLVAGRPLDWNLSAIVVAAGLVVSLVGSLAAVRGVGV